MMPQMVLQWTQQNNMESVVQKQQKLTLGKFEEINWMTNSSNINLFSFSDKYLPKMKQLLQDRQRRYENGDRELLENEMMVPKNWSLDDYSQVYPIKFQDELINAQKRNPIIIILPGEPSQN